MATTKKMQKGGSSTPVQFDMTNRELRKFRKETKKNSKEFAKDAMKKMKTGGMVNANATVSKQSTPGSKGVKSGVNTKASASKVARGRSGGTSTAPKTAVPKAKYGMSMRGK